MCNWVCVRIACSDFMNIITGSSQLSSFRAVTSHISTKWILAVGVSCNREPMDGGGESEK